MGKQKRVKEDNANTMTRQPSFINKHFSKIVFGVITAAIAILALVIFYPSGENKAELSTVSQEVLLYGESLYEASCASCHGADGAGNNQTQVPALNGSMHSWHHNDDYLINKIRYGGINMPAVGANEGWTDVDVEAALTYFKQWWTGQQRKVQQGSIGE